jgi:NAD(P)-dependent dehydrogenase (short-subunit alcohol dehydrogenase family)
MDIAGRSALVTGGSEGLGAALAQALASAGARVVVVARTHERLERVVEEMRGSGGEAHAIVADVGDKHAIARIAASAATLIGPVDILVNAASTLGPVPLRALMDTECEDLERVLEVNVFGPFRLIKAVAGSMVLRGTGLVLDISSDAAVEPYEGWGAYGLSKAALDHLTRTFAAELESTGVRFVAIDPGEMDTRMHADALPGADRTTLADPRDVSRRILDIVARPDRAPSGARVLAQGWEVSR